MVKVRSSRRVAGLKPSDYDHEIGLVNHDGAEDDSTSTSESVAQARRGSTASRMVSLVEDSEQGQGQQASISYNRQRDSHVLHDQSISPNPATSKHERASLETGASLPHPTMQPSIEVQGRGDAEVPSQMPLLEHELTINCSCIAWRVR